MIVKKIYERKEATAYLEKDTHIAELKYDGHFKFLHNEYGDYYMRIRILNMSNDFLRHNLMVLIKL